MAVLTETTQVRFSKRGVELVSGSCPRSESFSSGSQVLLPSQKRDGVGNSEHEEPPYRSPLLLPIHPIPFISIEQSRELCFHLCRDCIDDGSECGEAKPDSGNMESQKLSERCKKTILYFKENT